MADWNKIKYVQDDDDDALIERWKGLVRIIATTFAKEHFLPAVVDVEDFYNVGLFTLVNIARKYDESRGVPFARWISFCIKRKMITLLNSIQFSSYSAREINIQVDALTEEFIKEHGSRPSDEYVAYRLGMTMKEFRDEVVPAILACRDVYSLDAKSTTGNELPLSERLGFGFSVDPIEDWHNDIAQNVLVEALKKLNHRQRSVIIGYILEDRKLNDVADSLGISKHRASEAKRIGLARLHKYLVEHGFQIPNLLNV